MNLSDLRCLGQLDSGHDERIDYDANGLAIYIGVAQLNTPTSAAGWYIQKFTYDGSNQVTLIQCSKITAVWDNRATTFN